MSMSTAFIKRILQEFFVVMSIVSATGCYSAVPAAPQSAAVADVEHQRLIIKFKAGAIQCDAAGIAELSSATQVPIAFVRSMSGDACVIEQQAKSQESLLQGQELLRNQPSVEWLEEDRKMKALMRK